MKKDSWEILGKEICNSLLRQTGGELINQGWAYLKVRDKYLLRARALRSAEKAKRFRSAKAVTASILGRRMAERLHKPAERAKKRGGK